MEADQLIAEIAKATGLRLDKADPILAAAVINEVLLDQALAKLDRQVRIQADRVTAASTQAVLDAKIEAETLLSDAGEWIEARIKAAGDAAADKVRARLDSDAGKAEKSRRVSLLTAWTITVISLVLLSGLAGMAAAGMR